MSLPKPISRTDMYLSYLNHTKGLTLDDLPKPISRSDMYLYNLCINRGTGGGSGGSTTDNVVDRADRTQEQINRTFYKRMCKEIPSPSGEPITVNNGEEGYVLSAEIKGQTAKCIYIDKDIQTVVGTGTHWGSNHVTLTDTPQLEPNKEYTIFMQVFENTLDGEYAINSAQAQRAFLLAGTKISAGSTGLFSSKHTTQANFEGVLYSLYSTFKVETTTGTIKFRRCIVEGDYTGKINSLIPFGLSSTEAIISNNVQQYPIYANEEDKANKKVILLPFEEDTVTLNEDGSATWVKASNKMILNGSESYVKLSEDTDTIRFSTKTDNILFNSSNAINILCDKLKSVPNAQWANDTEQVESDNNGINIRVLKSKLSTPDNKGLKEWLNNNNLLIVYKLAVPTTIHIPKELVPIILTNKTNILEVGGAVKPSSFKVTVPVDRIAEIEARLQALESTTIDVVLNK